MLAVPVARVSPITIRISNYVSIKTQLAGNMRTLTRSPGLSHTGRTSDRAGMIVRSRISLLLGTSNDHCNTVRNDCFFPAGRRHAMSTMRRYAWGGGFLSNVRDVS
jgi:hypothetical protein